MTVDSIAKEENCYLCALAKHIGLKKCICQQDSHPTVACIRQIGELVHFEVPLACCHDWLISYLWAFQLKHMPRTFLGHQSIKNARHMEKNLYLRTALTNNNRTSVIPWGIMPASPIMPQFDLCDLIHQQIPYFIAKPIIPLLRKFSTVQALSVNRSICSPVFLTKWPAHFKHTLLIAFLFSTWAWNLPAAIL